MRSSLPSVWCLGSSLRCLVLCAIYQLQKLLRVIAHIEETVLVENSMILGAASRACASPPQG